MELDLENPLTNFNDFCPASAAAAPTTITSLLRLETHHMPTENYIKTLKARDLDIRREVVSLISQFSCKFGSFLSYLAVNYLDRFLSSQGTPVLQEPKTWVVRLLATSCVSLAAKMKKTEFSLTDFQRNGGLMFDAQTIERMEYLILGALKWRMRSITPFSFVSYFMSFFKLQDPPLRHALKARAVEIIFKAQIDINLLEFKPSIIAASALLTASHELFPLQFPCFRKVISSCSYVNKENMLKCYNSMQEVAKECYESIFDMVSSSNSTAVNVLDNNFLSSESGTTNGSTTGTTTTIKRRKINDYRRNQTVNLGSQVQHC